METQMKKYALFLFMFCGWLIQSQAQHIVDGVVKDALSGETLPSVNVIYGEGKAVSTNLDGAFSISLPKGEYTLQFAFVGYTTYTTKVSIFDTNLHLSISLEAELLNEVNVTADVAVGRRTPVAFSNIDPRKIKEELGTQDLPLLLNSTPGVYATSSGGGDGDARINIRGFNQRYVAVMIDGVPMNDMENGWVYWSNWFGLDGVTSRVQVQRGLGASKLAVPSIGGTINISTSGIEEKKKITVSSEYGNNNNTRIMVGINSGRLKNGWGITTAFSAKRNDGWVDHLGSKQLFYYFKVTKEFTNEQSLTFSIMGSPQRHEQRIGRQPLYVYSRSYAEELGQDVPNDDAAPGTLLYGDLGARYNPYWGYLTRTRKNPGAEKEEIADRVNYYHKPIINIKHFWTPDPKVAISNVVYASFGNGGGTALKQSAYDAYGQTDFQTIYNINSYGSIFDHPGDPAFVKDTSQYKSTNYLASRINNHVWVGLISTFKYKWSKDFELSGGIDARYYHTNRFVEVYDLLGGDYAVPNASGIDANDPSYLVLREGDKYDYNIRSFVRQQGAFFLGEYKQKNWTAFINATASLSTYNRVDYFGKKLADGNYPTSGSKAFPGATIKGGFNYNINSQQSVFLNTGYISRAPMLNNIYNTTSLEIYSNLDNEKLSAVEAGYMFNSKQWSITTNLYYTVWRNKPVIQAVAKDDETYRVSVPGMNALHTGFEVDGEYKLDKKLNIEGALSIGNWQWTSNKEAILTTEDGVTVLDTLQFSAKGVRVGDAAQTQGSFGVRWAPFKGFYIKPRITFFANNFSDFNPESLKDANANRQSWQMPNYALLDINLGYNYKLNEKGDLLGLKVNLMNVTDRFYISDARNNEYGSNFDAASAGVYVGMGFRWNIGLQYTF
jgi:iron complex outermembrane recepter protein